MTIRRDPPAPPAAPPGNRGRLGLHMTAAAAEGKLALQRCEDCGTAQYPPREVCGQCLSPQLVWKNHKHVAGELLGRTRIHHSNEEYFKRFLPLEVGLVHLEVGPTAVCFLREGCVPGQQVMVSAQLDASGQAVLVATPSAVRTIGRSAALSTSQAAKEKKHAA